MRCAAVALESPWLAIMRPSTAAALDANAAIASQPTARGLGIRGQGNGSPPSEPISAVVETGAGPSKIERLGWPALSAAAKAGAGESKMLRRPAVELSEGTGIYTREARTPKSGPLPPATGSVGRTASRSARRESRTCGVGSAHADYDRGADNPPRVSVYRPLRRPAARRRSVSMLRSTRVRLRAFRSRIVRTTSRASARRAGAASDAIRVA